jgi:hypothetical protein
VAGCAACRAELDELAGMADTLLLLGPEAEPPAGFESRVLDRLAAVRPAPDLAPRRRTWPVVSLAAAAAIVVGLAMGSVLARRAVPSSAPSTRVGAMEARVAGWKGRVVALPVAGHTASTELIVSATSARSYGTYSLEVVDRDGGVHRYDNVALTDGKVLWSRTIAEPVVDLRRVRMITTDGTVLCQATLTA